MPACNGCSRATACVGGCALFAAILLVCIPGYILLWRTPGDFTVDGSRDFSLDLSPEMVKRGCSYVLFYSGEFSSERCQSQSVVVRPPGVAGLAGLSWKPVNRTCDEEPLPWMKRFDPELQFLGTLDPLQESFVDSTPRSGEYHVTSAEPLWAISQCDYPMYMFLPIEVFGALGVFVMAGGGLALLALACCFCAVLVCCCERS